VCAAVEEVLPLQEYLRASGVRGEVGRQIDRGGPPCIVLEQLLELRDECRILLGRDVGLFEFLDGWDERLGNELPPKDTETSVARVGPA
jgi:hypothetical protein